MKAWNQTKYTFPYKNTFKNDKPTYEDLQTGSMLLQGRDSVIQRVAAM